MRASDPTQVETVTALARALGRGESPLRRWMRRPNWPFSRTPPWDVAQVKAWFEANEQAKPDPGRLGEVQLARLEVLREKREALRFAREKAAGLWLPREQVEAGRVARVQAAKAVLLRLPRRVTREAEERGLGREQAEALGLTLRQWIDEALAQLAK